MRKNTFHKIVVMSFVVTSVLNISYDFIAGEFGIGTLQWEGGIFVMTIAMILFQFAFCNKEIDY